MDKLVPLQLEEDFICLKACLLYPAITFNLVKDFTYICKPGSTSIYGP